LGCVPQARATGRAVYYLASAYPIFGCFAEVVAERLAREQPLDHADEHDVCRVVELQRKLGMMNEVDAQ
jgi:hypothetical protein